MDDYQFSIDMVNEFKAHGPKLFAQYAGQPCRYLEIGIYEGLSGCWMLDNILTHPDAQYVGVDLKEQPDTRSNFARHGKKATLIFDDSTKVVTKELGDFDMVFIDGCHSEHGCRRDLQRAWARLKPDGIMVCDDYDRDDYGVRTAVDEFLAGLDTLDYTLLEKGYQIAWRKNGWYNSRQVEVIYPHLLRTPKWLILGGPADGNEAQCLRQRYPELRVLGVEPFQPMCDWQRAHDWPANQPLLCQALAAKPGPVVLHTLSTAPRCGTLVPGETPRPDQQTIPGVTLDQLDKRYGPFEDAILWLDIEGAEYDALCGATRLLERPGAVQLINVELTDSRPEQTKQLPQFFAEHGFQLVHTWNKQAGLCCDQIYVSQG